LNSNFSIKQLVELDACTRCGECQVACEAFTNIDSRNDRGREDLVSPSARLWELRAFLKGKRPGILSRLSGGREFDESRLKDLAAGAYRCTTCARCVERCPVGIELRSLWLATREELAAAGYSPEELDVIRQAVADEHNIVGYPNVERASWVDYMVEAPEDGYIRPGALVVYFVGCVSSFSPAVQSIAEAYAQTLDAAGVSSTILGEDEWCCGFPLLAAGMSRAAEEVKRHNIEKIRSSGAKAVTFSCPSCYKIWRDEYSIHLPGVELIHSTQFLARLIAQGRLKPGQLDLEVTYHDPCDLARNAGVYEAPRRVLTAIPGLRLIEAKHVRKDGHCCGGGGDLEVTDVELAGRIADGTVRSLLDTGAHSIVSACQQCKRTLVSSVQRQELENEVLDIVEVVWKAVSENG